MRARSSLGHLLSLSRAAPRPLAVLFPNTALSSPKARGRALPGASAPGREKRAKGCALHGRVVKRGASDIRAAPARAGPVRAAASARERGAAHRPSPARRIGPCAPSVSPARASAAQMRPLQCGAACALTLRGARAASALRRASGWRASSETASAVLKRRCCAQSARAAPWRMTLATWTASAR